MGEVPGTVWRGPAFSLPTVTRRLSATTATWTVTTTADLADAAPGNGICATAGRVLLAAGGRDRGERARRAGPDRVQRRPDEERRVRRLPADDGDTLALTDSHRRDDDRRLHRARLVAEHRRDALEREEPDLSSTRRGAPAGPTTRGSSSRAAPTSSAGSPSRPAAPRSTSRRAATARFVGNWFGFTTTGANMGSGDLRDRPRQHERQRHRLCRLAGRPERLRQLQPRHPQRGLHDERTRYRTTSFGITPAGAPSTIGCAGFDWNSGAHSNQIGGLAANQGNHFAHTGCTGIELSHGYTGSGAAPGGDDRWNNEYNTIQGNTFGLDAFGRYAGGAYLSAGSNDDQASLSRSRTRSTRPTA